MCVHGMRKIVYISVLRRCKRTCDRACVRMWEGVLEGE